MSNSNTQILLVISAKGGIGASIMSTTFASALSAESRTIYIDLDNGYSFTKDDINQNGNTKLDFLQCDLSNIDELINLAKPLYKYIVIDVKGFFLTQEVVTLIEELSALSFATIVPVSTSPDDLIITKEFLSILSLSNQTKTIIIDNEYRSTGIFQKESLLLCLPKKNPPNLIISKISFPIIKSHDDPKNSSKIKSILNDLILHIK